MDTGNPWAIFSAVLIGIIGMALFIYGKKQLNIRCLATGAAMCIVPYFVGSVAALWLFAAACIASLYYASRWL